MLTSSSRRPAALLLLWTASVALSWAPLEALVRLSLNDNRYSHLVVIPLLSAGLLYWKREKVFRDPRWCPRLGLPLVAIGAALLAAARSPWLPQTFALSLAVFAVALIWVAVFVLCYGVRAFSTARFPFLLLLLVIPVPLLLMDRIILVLQTGSTEISHAFFKLAGIPVFRDGFTFELPGVGFQVAEECSSIHSAWALFITALLAGHFFLRSLWSKLCLAALTVPVAVFGNAIRIFTIWFLGTHVNVGFFYGNLHRNGGILFALVSLSVLLSFLSLLRKVDRRAPARACLLAESQKPGITKRTQSHFRTVR